MNPRLLLMLLAAAVGMVLGAGTTLWLTQSSDEAPRPTHVDDGERAAATAAESAADVERTPPASTTQHAGSAVSDAQRAERSVATADSLFSAQLQAFARTEAARGWREVRSDEIPADVLDSVLRDYQRQLQSLPHALGLAAARARNDDEKKAAAFASDDGIALLQAIRGDEPEARELVGSDRFAALFARRGGGQTVDGATSGREPKVPDGSVISFPAGVFAVGELARGREPFPADLTLRGAGMNATLLVMECQGAHGPMRRLAIEDCTVRADGLLDLRSAPAIVALTRMRLVGFDTGAGGSVALDVRQIALRAVECRFESGYGRAPHGYANLLRSSQARLARFDRCVFERLSLDDADGPAVLFVDCSFVDMLEAQPRGPTFQNWRYTVMAGEQQRSEQLLRRDLGELFPQWQQRLPR